ncbi:LysR family transcriptional regulator [Janthinobacterium sp. Mn2066]|uniref:LysR family transcriptional regulator n=1 Tax=Janthinobacterium sp. Mn2066 TaxID=3395264 RepID=UPI003BBA8C34
MRHMVNLNRFQSFISIVEMKSFTRAAAHLGLSKAMLSFNLKQLEAELGVSLLTRTTRRLALTQAGERFYADCVSVVRQAEAAIDDARSSHQTLSGTLRVTSTAEYGVRFVVPALATFAAEHRDLQVDFSASPQPADLIAQQFDLAIRLGSLSDSSYRAARVAQFQTVAVATPAYLARHPAVRVPEDLQAMDGIFHSRFEGALTWTADDGATFVTQHARRRIVADNASAMLAFVLADTGVAVLPDWLVADELRSGRLQRLLSGYRLPQQGTFAVFPNTPHVPAKVQRFIAHFREYVAAQPAADT